METRETEKQGQPDAIGPPTARDSSWIAPELAINRQCKAYDCYTWPRVANRLLRSDYQLHLNANLSH